MPTEEENETTAAVRAEYARINTPKTDKYTDPELKPLVLNFMKNNAGCGYTYNEIKDQFQVVYVQASRVVAALVAEKKHIVYHQSNEDNKPVKQPVNKKPIKKLHWYAPKRAALDQALTVPAKQKIIQTAIYEYVWDHEGCTESQIRAHMIHEFVHLSVGSILAAAKVLVETDKKITVQNVVVETPAGKRLCNIYKPI